MVLSLTIGFWVDFCVCILDRKVSIYQSYRIKSCSYRFKILGILNIFEITNCVGVTLLLFALIWILCHPLEVLTLFILCCFECIINQNQ